MRFVPHGIEAVAARPVQQVLFHPVRDDAVIAQISGQRLKRCDVDVPGVQK
jgi:hypothetical protein